MPERLSDADLQRIRERHDAAPPGPWIASRYVSWCWCLHAGAILDERGRLTSIGRPVTFVLATPGGRVFCERSWVDVSELLAHAEAQDAEIRALRVRLALYEKPST